MKILELAYKKHNDWNNIVKSFGCNPSMSEDVVMEMYIQLEINTVNKEWITVSCKRSRGYAFETFSFSINEFGLPFVVGEIYDPLEYFVPRTLTPNKPKQESSEQIKAPF